MSLTLFACDGGRLSLPDPQNLLSSREDGGNLVVLPPRQVWERGELSAAELTQWSFLVAAAAHAMLQTLAQLDGGCVNYWEAGNWALNDAAEPAGRKRASEHRRVHLHLIGRSPTSQTPTMTWGESPIFPRYAERHEWSSAFARLHADECRAIVTQLESRLLTYYGVARRQIEEWRPCGRCHYPSTLDSETAELCPECLSSA